MSQVQILPGELIKIIMSTSDNKTSKTLESPLDEPSRPALTGHDEKRYNSTRVYMHENSGYTKSGSRRNGQNYFYYLAGGRSVSYCGP